MSTPPRIAVLGAGLAGLAAATQLIRDGHDVTVFEARDRVGGRLWSETMEAGGGEHVIERGAEFVLDGYSLFREYCERHGLELVDTGMSYYIRTPVDRPGVTTDDMESLGTAAARRAEASAGLSVADVLDDIEANGPVREALEARVEMSTAVRTDQVVARGTLDHVASFDPGPSWRVSGGNQRLPCAMAEGLGGRVALGRRVEAVVQSAHEVEVVLDDGREVFDYVVAALPFSLVAPGGDVALDLSQEKRDAMARVVQGHAAKLHLGLKRAPETSAVMNVSDRFWTWTAYETPGRVAPVINSFGGELDHLIALGLENGAQTWEDRVRTQRGDLEIMERSAVLTAWSLDPMAQGAYTAHAPDFSDGDFVALAAPEGRVHFAGEYIDPEYTGLMEGALRSGESAAQRLMKTLSGAES
ncbi:flavin monoamine oxidase family protein [Rothia santali]|uniref:flavin monoamine oxidase family protein n=1 Tax=Rothia santali TaxID=2949643 RepID=UPI002665E327|nr:NAD(P)/FAD-dependent oxidoreductase [Rothia santali]